MSLDLAALPVHVASITCSSAGSRDHPHAATLSSDGTLLAWAAHGRGASLASLCHRDGDGQSTGARLRQAAESASELASSGAVSIQRHALPVELGTAVAKLALTRAWLLVARPSSELVFVDLADLSQVGKASLPPPG